MKSKFALAPLALSVSLLLAQSALANSFEPVDLSLPSRSKAAAGFDPPRLRWVMSELPSAFDAKALGAEGVARAHLGQLLRQQDQGKAASESFELHSVSAMANGSSIVQFTRRVNGIEVFREDVGLLLDAKSRLIAFRGSDRLTQSQAKALPAFSLSAADAVATAMSAYGFDRATALTALRSANTVGDYQWFTTAAGLRSAAGAENHRPLRAKPVYFPAAGEGLVPAYYVETQIQPDAASSAEYYAHVLSAVDGRVLFRHFQQADGGNQFNYRVWAEAPPLGLPQPSPFGRDAFPHPTGNNDGYSPSYVLPALVAMENAPFSQGDDWLANGASVSTGNNADGYLDLVAPDGFGAGDIRPTTTAPGTFDRTYNTAAEPNASTDQRMAASIQQFYWINWLHDFHYDSGFAEVDGNAQQDNFGRGGLGNDRILAEGQDNSGTNNANMATPADGASPRMQMYVFSPVAPHTLTFNSTNYGHGVSTTFGPQSFNISGNVVAAIDAADVSGPTTTDGCTALTNAAQVSGKIAFIDRGTCGFTVKVKNAQNANATGVIIGNVASSSSPTVPPGMGGTDATITIGAMSVNLADGDTMRSALAGGPVDTATLFRGTGVGRDGTIDGTVIAHEWGHYISNRLVGNASGLSNTQGRSMGEGWGDFNALLALVKNGDDFTKTYAIGGYALGAPYFGFRRYPYAYSFDKNPLTFAHVVNNVALPASPAPSFGADGAQNAEVHNAGEVWTAALFDCYLELIDNHSFADAQDRMKEYVIGGYKMTPSAPTFLEARDAILATIAAADIADFEICAAGFARRGMGMLAVAAPRDTTTNVGAVADTTISGDLATQSVEGDDLAGCDNDSYLDLDEDGELTIDVRNTGWVSLTGGSVTITSNHAGLSFPSGNSGVLPSSVPYESSDVSIPIRLTSVPPSHVVQFTAEPNGAGIINPPGTAKSVYVRVASNEVLASSAVENFGANNYPWSTQLANGATAAFEWTRSATDAAGKRFAFGPDTSGVGTTSLVSDPIAVGSGNFSIALTHRYSFEADTLFWDGGVIEISTDNGNTWTSIGGATYDGTINGDLAAGNPLHGASAYVGNSPGYPATTVDTINLGTTYAGQNVRLRFTVATDQAAGAPGWELHSVALTGAGTPFAAVVPHDYSCSPTGNVMFADGFEG